VGSDKFTSLPTGFTEPA
jgi:hypothetical protein